MKNKIKYFYEIRNKKVYELTNDMEHENHGTDIDFIISVKKQNKQNNFTNSFQRKMDWLFECHPELTL